MLKFLEQHLTSRELEVLILVASGASAKEIARQLHITSRTVETHINHLKLKTRSRNRAHLVAIALEEGLIDNPCHMMHSIAHNARSVGELSGQALSRSAGNEHTGDQGEMFQTEQM